jgi:integrase
MPKRAITQLFLDRISPPKAGVVVYWDSNQPGLGLRISATGAKSWFTMYRVNGRQVKETIGTLATIPSVAEARRRALSSLEKARSGVNPVEERKAAKTRTAGNTVAAAAARYLASCDRNLAPKTAREWRRIFQHDVLPRWGERPLAEITKGDVLVLLDEKAARRERKGTAEGAGVQANRTLTRLRTFFRWCVANDICTADPTLGVRKPVKEASRDRVLTDDEIMRFWDGSVPLCRLLLLTAQRVGEVSGMRWSEIDFDSRTWTIPKERAKNGKAHTVHLSSLATEVLAEVPHRGDRLFTGNNIDGIKARLEAAVGAGDWTLHDLRRTAVTGMARLGIAPHVADRVLNHQAGTIRGVAAVYNRFEYLEERKAALEAWGRFVDSLVRPGGAGNVVPLRGNA